MRPWPIVAALLLVLLVFSPPVRAGQVSQPPIFETETGYQNGHLYERTRTLVHVYTRINGVDWYSHTIITYSPWRHSPNCSHSSHRNEWYYVRQDPRTELQTRRNGIHREERTVTIRHVYRRYPRLGMDIYDHTEFLHCGPWRDVCTVTHQDGPKTWHWYHEGGHLYSYQTWQSIEMHDGQALRFVNHSSEPQDACSVRTDSREETVTYEKDGHLWRARRVTTFVYHCHTWQGRHYETLVNEYFRLLDAVDICPGHGGTSYGHFAGARAASDYTDYLNAVVGHVHQRHIEEATELGLVIGCDNGEFRPDEAITLQQFANIITRNYHQRDLSEEENLAYLASLGVDTSRARSPLDLPTLLEIARAVEGLAGLGELAILGEALQGTAVPEAAGGHFSRAQAIRLIHASEDLVGDTKPPATDPAPSPPDIPAAPPEPDPRLTAALNPERIRRGEKVAIEAETDITCPQVVAILWDGNTVYLEQVASGADSLAWRAELTIADTQPDGAYPVKVVYRKNGQEVRRVDLVLTISGSLLEDLLFIISD